jgi:DNA-directed RNA polymerase sigma subunit (sigma70/sigma32)
MRECLEACRRLDVSCPNKDCRHWIDYAEEKNCIFESVSRNGNMTLREIADRLGISFVRVKQIQDKTLKKISHLFL